MVPRRRRDKRAEDLDRLDQIELQAAQLVRHEAYGGYRQTQTESQLARHEAAQALSKAKAGDVESEVDRALGVFEYEAAVDEERKRRQREQQARDLVFGAVVLLVQRKRRAQPVNDVFEALRALVSQEIVRGAGHEIGALELFARKQQVPGCFHPLSDASLRRLEQRSGCALVEPPASLVVELRQHRLDAMPLAESA